MFYSARNVLSFILLTQSKHPKINVLSESCPTVFELAHCWKETPHGEYLFTDCPRLNPIPSELHASGNTKRPCYAESHDENGTIQPAGWVGISDVYHGMHS